MDENLKPIQIKIVASGTEEAVKSINSVTSALRELQKVSKSVSNSMSSIKGLKGNIFNFGNLDIDQSKVYDKSKTEIKNYKNYVENLDKSTKNYNRTLNKNTQVVKNNYKQVSKMFNGSSSSTLKLFGSMYATNKIVKYLSEAFDESASWVENLNVMEVAFRGVKKSADGLKNEFIDLSKDAYNFTKAVSSSFGLDANQMLQYVSLFQQMASAMGQSTETAYQMSTALTLLGTDVASLYNKDVGVTMEALRSAIAGQVKPVRQFGFDITSYSIDGLIEEMGILEGYTSRMMTQSQKQLARTILLIQQSKNAWGDLAKTMNTYSNQQKILESQFTNLKRAIGDLFIGTGEQIGIATRLLYGLNGVVMALVETIRVFIPEASASGFNQVTKNLEDTNNAANELEETMNGALLSFDKFNTLSQAEGKGNTWITSELESKLAKEYSEYLKQWNERMENVQSIAHDIRDTIMSFLGFTKESVTTVDELGNEFTTVKFVLKDGYSNLSRIRDIIISIVGTYLTTKVISLASALVGLIAQLKATATATMLLQKAQKALMSVGIFLLIQSITTLIMNWKDLDGYQKVAYISLTALSAAMVAFSALSNKQVVTAIIALVVKFGSLKMALLQCTAAMGSFAVLALGVATLINSWDEMSGWQRVITILGAVATAALAAAIAIGVFHTTWTFGLGAAAIGAGIALLLGSMASVKANMESVGTYAQGGFPDKGSMFIANERGPELVGNIGGRTAVANNDMIVTAIENASYKGMVTAMASAGGNNINLKINANSNDLSRALAKSMAIEFKRQGYKI